jgi:hypothetical protein
VVTSRPGSRAGSASALDFAPARTRNQCVARIGTSPRPAAGAAAYLLVAALGVEVDSHGKQVGAHKADDGGIDAGIARWRAFGS